MSPSSQQRSAQLRSYLHVPGLMHRSVVFYPVSICYLVAVSVMYLVVDKRLGILAGAGVLGGLFSFVLLLAMWREIHTVHKLVNSQRDELLARIDQLLDALKIAGVAIPSDQDL